MHVTLSNHLCEVTQASEDEEEWLDDYLSISEPVFVKDFRSGRMVRRGTATHCFVKRGKFPAGFLRLVYKGAKREGYKLHIDDQRVGASVEPEIPDYHIVQTFSEELELKKSGAVRAWLRYYQMDALKAVIHRRRGIVWHPTGSGKTELAVAMAQSINVKWLFVVQDKDLLYNAAERYEKRTGKKAGIIGDGRVELDVDGNFIVAMAQTLDRKRGDHELWEVVRTAEGLVIDECFPAGTLVDGRPIEGLRAGDQITSYNEATGRLETKRVARVMESTTNALVRLTLADGRTIVCTPNHPLLTPTGWKPAGSLSGSLVLSSTHHAEEATNHQPSQVRNVWNYVHSRVPGLVRHQEEETQERLLHQNVCAQRSERRGIKEEPTHIRRDLSEDAYQEPDAQREDEGKDDGKSASELSAMGTTSARRKRPWSYARGKEPIHRIGKCVGDAARCANEEATRIGISNELQDRPRTPSAEASSRSGRGIPQEPCTADAGLKEREPTAWARVDRVEILQQGGRSGFERVCPGGKVYNIEVEDNHTYVVNGVVVHNCHQTPAKTIFQITQMSENAVYRIGLSGTPLDRGDQKGMATIGALGPVIHRVKSEELQARGFLSEAFIEMLICHHKGSKAKTYQGGYSKDIVKNTKRNKLVVETMLRANKPNLTFVKQLNHGKELVKRAEKAGLRVEFVWGNTSTSKRADLIKRLERGDIDAIICNVVWQQGVDIPSLASVVRASAGKSVISALQTIGRGTRVTEWKNTFQVFDIFDTIDPEEDEDAKDWFTKHSRARKRSYEREGHKVNVVDPKQLTLL